MKQYLELMALVHRDGVPIPDRTGTGTLSLHSQRMQFDISPDVPGGPTKFPLITTKKIHFKSVIEELLWMLSGSTNAHDLQRRGVSIWNEWAAPNGALGPIYGKQWRDFQGVDQIAKLVDGIRANPYGRRHIVSAWNPAEIEDMALPPCHAMFQVFIREGKLSLQMYQRSADMFLGVPFNIASYGLLAAMLAATLGYETDQLTVCYGDLHIYANHAAQCSQQMRRTVRCTPHIKILQRREHIWDYEFEDFEVIGYNPAPHIAGKVSV